MVTDKLAAEVSVPAQEDDVAVGDASAASKTILEKPVAAEDGNVVVGDVTAVAEPFESRPVAKGLAKAKPTEIVAPEAGAEAKAKNIKAAVVASAKVAADAEEKAEATRLMEEASEPQLAQLKVTGEKNVSNNLADYGEYYSSSDD